MATVLASAAFAGETTVHCKNPLSQIATGRDGTSPRFTVFCAGGSSVGAIDYFAFRISDNPTAALLLEQQLGPYLQIHGAAAQLTILTNLSDISGAAWGCGAANCRIISYMYGD